MRELCQAERPASTAGEEPSKARRFCAHRSKGDRRYGDFLLRLRAMHAVAVSRASSDTCVCGP